MPGLGFTTYHVIVIISIVCFIYLRYFVMVGASSENSEISSVETPLAGFTLSNKYLRSFFIISLFLIIYMYLTVNLDIHGDIQSVVLAGTGQTVTLSQEYQYYVSNTGDSASPQPSGAYLFAYFQEQT